MGLDQPLRKLCCVVVFRELNSVPEASFVTDSLQFFAFASTTPTTTAHPLINNLSPPAVFVALPLRPPADRQSRY